MLESIIEQAVQAEVVKQSRVYRHFKGGYYLILSVARVESTGEEVVVYQSMQDGNIWTRPTSDFLAEVPVDKHNPTGQKYRFEQVKSFNNQLSMVPTDTLLKELLSRNDCPIELHAYSPPEKLWRTEYLVGRYDMRYVDRETSYEDFMLTNIFDSLDRAISYAKSHNQPDILKRVCIKQDFD